MEVSILKLKRLGALTAAMALTLSVTALPAAAAEFKDVLKPIPGVQEGDWAYEYITKMSNLGLAGGYPDGTFKPDGKMTAAECLLFCTRTTGVSADTKASVARAHAAQLKKILPADMYDWSYPELALAMEAGVLSASELDALSDAGSLGKTITRENICLYLVRAMQLEPLAKSLTTYALPFADRDSIAPSLRPYVYVLNNFGIIKGMENNRFEPQGKVTRAQMTTMLSRAVDFIAHAGISVELSEFTDHDWRGGIIETVSTTADGGITLALNNELTGRASYTLSAGVKVLQDNMVPFFNDDNREAKKFSVLKPGQYVRLNLTASGAVREVRLGGALTTSTGTVTALDRDQISIAVNGVSKSYKIDRFTQLSAGQTPISRDSLNLNHDYTAASCSVDAMGHLAAVKLSGGTQLAAGLILDMKNTGSGVAVRISKADGKTASYEIPYGAAVTVDGGVSELNSKLVGKYIQLRISNDSGKVSSAEVNTTARYIQGPIKHIGTSANLQTVTIRDSFTGRDVTCTVHPDAVLTYQGAAITGSRLEKDCFATARIDGNSYTRIDTYPGVVTVEGVLSSISFGTTTLLQVTTAAGETLSYQLDINSQPDIIRNGKASSVDQLRAGDQLVITIRYNTVSEIEAVPRAADLRGTITDLNMSMNSMTLGLTLSDGSPASYPVSGSASVTLDGKSADLSVLRPGQVVEVVTNSDTIVAINVVSATASESQVSGTVFSSPDITGEPVMKVLVSGSQGNSSFVTVDVRNADVLRLSPKTKLSYRDLDNGDPVTCFGKYSGGTFLASIVIVLN